MIATTKIWINKPTNRQNQEINKKCNIYNNPTIIAKQSPSALISNLSESYCQIQEIQRLCSQSTSTQPLPKKIKVQAVTTSNQPPISAKKEIRLKQQIGPEIQNNAFIKAEIKLLDQAPIPSKKHPEEIAPVSPQLSPIKV